MIKPTVIIDPGHGMENREPNRYDPGVVFAGVEEAALVMSYANDIRADLLQRGGVRVVRTRVDRKDPAPIGQRAAIARRFNGRIMLSLHINSAGPTATGTEVFYRGEENRLRAAVMSATVADILGIPDRGPKRERQSQHGRLAVMGFQPTFLLELGFVTNTQDRTAFTDPAKKAAVVKYLAGFLRSAVVG